MIQIYIKIGALISSLKKGVFERLNIKRRKSQRLTQEALAILAGVRKPTLNSFEQGKTTLTLASILKILHTLGLD
ncbi:MAG: hypothetical protein B7Y25_05445 [Alphaproteobacteria bacterium 16-39-46]|nr:MAG: hypothetical protein B7Y25_05445 [Alphaproteobacteria bacterium 16-39-46]OZA42672.1 MAG: hypothetical protein B7X84_05340 [Alphaproteobacteria bacterium 17-39-52]HQS84370.1 helix-turn-helix domain-containing protein [Alphaproteobacteria bacterium]HQS94184.1 helix-turn-helix domain-containing protein [Alphaproteobacteria bacterium]